LGAYASPMGWELATAGLALLLLAAVSRLLSATPVTPAMLMVAIGVIAGPLLLGDRLRASGRRCGAAWRLSRDPRRSAAADRRDLAADHPGSGRRVRVRNSRGARRSGFIAAFVAGMLYGLLARKDTAKTTGFIEEAGALLDAVTFLVFGAVLLGPALEDASWRVAAYAVLSLTVVRMLPAAVSLLGTGASWPTIAFMGWFGPRGLASIVFAVVVEDTHQAHSPTILTATYLTVGLSVFLHGLSAVPLVGRYARWYTATREQRPPTMESQPAHEHRARLLVRHAEPGRERAA
jgi:hypothetical protein